MIELIYQEMSEHTHHFRLGYRHCLNINNSKKQGVFGWWEDYKALDTYLTQTYAAEISSQDIWIPLNDGKIFCKSKEHAMMIKLGWNDK